MENPKSPADDACSCLTAGTTHMDGIAFQQFKRGMSQQQSSTHESYTSQ